MSKGGGPGPSPEFSPPFEFELGRVVRGRLWATGSPGADFADTVSDSVEPKIGNAEQTLGGFQQMACQDVELDPSSQDHGGEEGDGVDQDGHVAQALIGQHPDVFQIVALLDEADRFLDAPAGEIGADHPPRGRCGSCAKAGW